MRAGSKASLGGIADSVYRICYSYQSVGQLRDPLCSSHSRGPVVSLDSFSISLLVMAQMDMQRVSCMISTRHTWSDSSLTRLGS